VQAFGDLVTFHPHIHALVADGVFVESGTFRVLPPIPTALLAEPLRHAVLDYLVENEAITEEFAHRLLSWKHSGFSVDNTVGVAANDPQGRRQLARYMIRNPFSLKKMEYQAKQGMVVYRSRYHATLKRNFQIMPGAAWLKLLLQRVPDRGEHLVRHYGWYSNRGRGHERQQRRRRRCRHRSLMKPSRGSLTTAADPQEKPCLLRSRDCPENALPAHARPVGRCA